MLKLIDKTNGKDISQYIVSIGWSGDMSQAGRKISIETAYNPKDKAFVPAVMELGDKVELTYINDSTKKAYKIFSGVVFLRSRKSESYTMEYTAYDHMIYLAKSKMNAKFTNLAVSSVIQQVCSTLGVTYGSCCQGLDLQVSFIADNMSGTEVIKKALGMAAAKTGKKYHVLMVDDKVQVIQCDKSVVDYKISDTTNLTSASHEESLEDMINQVAIADKDGNIIGYVHNDDDVKKYGMLQSIYKVDEKQDTATAAKAMLKKVAETSSLSAIGDVQCIAGYAVTVQEEQIKGIFLVKSDSHKFANGQHTMDLTLDFLEVKNDGQNASQQGTLPAAKAAPGTAGSLSIDSGMDVGEKAWIGQAMNNGTNGCVEAATKVGSYYSPFLASECNNGVVGVDQLVSDAGDNCIPFDSAKLEKGDVIVYGNNDHVVIAAGPSGDYIGNSSGQNQVVHGSSYMEMGMQPTKIIKTSHM